MSFALYSPEDTVMLPNLPSKKSPPPPPWPSKKKDDLYSFDFLGIQSPWNAKLDSIQDLWREKQVERRPSLSSSVSSLDDQVDDEDDFCPFWPSGASPLRPLRPMDFNKFNKYSHRRHSAGVVAAGEANGNSRLMQQRGTRPTDLIGYITESNNKSTNTSSTAAAAARRHSLAGVLDQALLDDIDSYFSRRRDVSMGGEQDLGKGVPVQRLGDTKLYKVEFKEGRTDLFYYNVNENEHKDDVSALREGQYVLVEGDRGHDLGCIVADDVNTSSLRKEAVVRRVFRPATDLEISSLRFKEGDEEKALALCKAKVKEYGLPMQVVRAEYQWDRRKLTFFFESDTRVDFRDLVRDLFKTYKTRIWMCSLNSACNSTTQQEQA